MDETQFDALTRTLSSRRTALTGLLSGVTALLGLDVPQEAEAHNPTARCRQLPTPAKRRACLRRARAHNRTHRCRALPATFVCGERCGQTVFNNCGQLVTCSCPGGQTCLSNGSCAQVCGFGLPDCPAGCGCSTPQVGGGSHCNRPLSCEQMVECESTAQCPLNHQCQETFCDSGGGDPVSNWCVPLCPF